MLFAPFAVFLSSVKGWVFLLFITILANYNKECVNMWVFNSSL